MSNYNLKLPPDDLFFIKEGKFKLSGKGATFLNNNFKSVSSIKTFVFNEGIENVLSKLSIGFDRYRDKFKSNVANDDYNYAFNATLYYKNIVEQIYKGTLSTEDIAHYEKNNTLTQEVINEIEELKKIKPQLLKDKITEKNIEKHTDPEEGLQKKQHIDEQENEKEVEELQTKNQPKPEQKKEISTATTVAHKGGTKKDDDETYESSEEGEDVEIYNTGTYTNKRDYKNLFHKPDLKLNPIDTKYHTFSFNLKSNKINNSLF